MADLLAGFLLGMTAVLVLIGYCAYEGSHSYAHRSGRDARPQQTGDGTWWPWH